MAEDESKELLELASTLVENALATVMAVENP